jgi:quinol monooxygenase YgiN
LGKIRTDGVRVIVKVCARQDSIPAIKSILMELTVHSRKEKGCVSYEVLQNKTDQSVFMLVEEWDSVSALDAHNNTPHFHSAVSTAQPFLAKELDVGRYVMIG